MMNIRLDSLWFRKCNFYLHLISAGYVRLDFDKPYHEIKFCILNFRMLITW